MLYFYQLGDKLIVWLRSIANFFTIPMNSPEFMNMLGLGSNPPGIIGAVTGSGGFANPILRLLISFAGDLTFLEFFMSTGFFIFVAITLLKWILPTS